MNTRHRWIGPQRLIGLGALVLVLLAASSADAQERRGRNRWSRMVDWDADGDGAVSREEFQGPEQLFDRMDADGDGKITEAEANGRQRGGRDSGRATTDARTRIDADGDGTITAAEWKAFYAKADTNRDGKIQKAEWEAAILGTTTTTRGGPPAVGDAAPKVGAKRAGGEETVDLSKPKRTTVLIFGSYT